MAKLILSLDGLVLKEIDLDKERITIGRKSHNDIQIENLAISGEHAAVVTILGDSFLEDLDSTNGTYVNGTAVKKHALRNNDVIELGKYKLKYINDPAIVGSTPHDLAKAVPHAGIGHGAEMPPTGADAGALPPLPVAAIQLLSGANAGKELELTKNLTSLGKPGVQVAVIARRPHGYFITHVEGAHFPSVNGRVLDAQAHPLADHDVIDIAGVKMEFFFKA